MRNLQNLTPKIHNKTLNLSENQTGLERHKVKESFKIELSIFNHTQHIVVYLALTLINFTNIGSSSSEDDNISIISWKKKR
jgi:hypothetical protein